MEIPVLDKTDYESDYSWLQYKRYELIIAYLFNRKGFERLDEDILNIKNNLTRGMLSNRFLHAYLGLTGDFQREVSNHTVYEFLNELKLKGDDAYNEIINILQDYIDREDVGKNELYYGVPGSGKSWKIKDKYGDNSPYLERVLFHPDYTYSDFVGQILPKTSGNQVDYPFIPGPFTLILKKAYENPEQHFYLIIEEINRGNAPAIFGDIFQLLDRKKEIKDENDDGFPIGTSEYEITNSDIAKIVYNDENHKVRIPSNLSIIASMNTSDQNVFTLDTAFQRRWDMKLIRNNFEDHDYKDVQISNTGVSWEDFNNIINDEILDLNKNNLSSEDKRLGTYFIRADDLQDDQKFSEKVLKYLWDDAFKFYRSQMFNLEKHSLENLIDKFIELDGIEKFTIFDESIYNKLKAEKQEVTTSEGSDDNEGDAIEESSHDNNIEGNIESGDIAEESQQEQENDQ